MPTKTHENHLATKLLKKFQKIPDQLSKHADMIRRDVGCFRALFVDKDGLKIGYDILLRIMSAKKLPFFRSTRAWPAIL